MCVSFERDTSSYGVEFYIHIYIYTLLKMAVVEGSSILYSLTHLNG